jgi:hypothetical protein
MRGEMVLAADVAAEWSAILRTVRAAMLPSRWAALRAHDVAETDADVRDVLIARSRRIRNAIIFSQMRCLQPQFAARSLSGSKTPRE